MEAARQVDQDRLHAFLGKAVQDLGAAMSAALVLIGDELGLYKALAEAPATPGELARRTGTNERYIREWLGNQAAGGYVDYDAHSGQYAMNAEQRLCLADPGGAARHAREALKADGHCMLVEPFAADDVSGNLNPVGRVYYGASSLICVPVSLAGHGPALGAQAGEKRLRDIMAGEGGFHHFRRATETPFNIVFEARP